jgi:hypothetical protein
MRLPDQTGSSDAKTKDQNGVGTVIRKVLNRAGIPSCEGCKARERMLNNLFKANVKER